MECAWADKACAPKKKRIFADMQPRVGLIAKKQEKTTVSGVI